MSEDTGDNAPPGPLRWHADLPDRWTARLEDYLKGQLNRRYQSLSGEDFQADVRIRFEDGSFVSFNFALVLVAEDAGEVAIFTEHCGYHVFPAEPEDVEIMPR